MFLLSRVIILSFRYIFFSCNNLHSIWMCSFSIPHFFTKLVFLRTGIFAIILSWSMQLTFSNGPLCFQVGTFVYFSVLLSSSLLHSLLFPAFSFHTRADTRRILEPLTLWGKDIASTVFVYWVSVTLRFCHPTYYV